ncbi:MAG: heat-inducible transcriptional repressor HrcA [Actinomycetaceae bacterium]|nr:heat-inducible transcriptional repressor HrcA [Actinomycetaceae bacterium]MDY6083130.1 heat-inducible transcriptional repressor HrcA [Actinomycetaceae bacterium]
MRGKPEPKHVRQSRILEAVIRDYVETREPVGSRSLVARHHLDVSPATVRNDMAALEEAGLIAQPHTSAGRIPTDAGYRSFVDTLNRLKPLSRAERHAFEKFLAGSVDLDDTVQRAVRLLAKVTHQVAIVQYPSLQRVSVRHVELIPVGTLHAMVIIITAAGRVEQRTLQFSAPIDITDLAKASELINDAVDGKDLDAIREVAVAGSASSATSAGSDTGAHASASSHATSSLTSSASEAQPMNEEPVTGARDTVQAITAIVLHTIQDALIADSEERVAVAGVANLSRHEEDFARSISPVLDALEEQVILLKLMTSIHHDASDPSASAASEGVSVSIGQENEHEGLAEASVVTAGYNVDHTAVGRLGIVGPTRMDYPESMRAVYAVAHYLSDILSPPTDDEEES